MKFKITDNIRYLFRAHILNWIWRGSELRKNIRNDAYSALIKSYLSKYIPFIRSLHMPELAQKENNKNEKIFSLWLQGIDNAPDLIKKCISSVKSKYNNAYLLIEEDNLNEYLTLPSFIQDKRNNGQIGAAHYADIVRLALLNKYGGIWMDATLFLTDKIPQSIYNEDFFMFMAAGEYSYVFVQNYFIRSNKGDALLNLWLATIYEYWKNEDKAVDYFFAQYLFQLLVTHNSQAKRLFEKMKKLPGDAPQTLWTKIGNEPFDESKYQEMCAASFFQKISYKKRKNFVGEIIPGSMADFVINGKM